MLIYKYHCGSCREEYEFFQCDSDDYQRLCPECAGSLVQLALRTSVSKKSGWYVADYKNGGHVREHKEADHLAWHKHDKNLIP